MDVAVECAHWGVLLLREYGDFLHGQRELGSVNYWLFALGPFAIVLVVCLSFVAALHRVALAMKFGGSKIMQQLGIVGG